MRVVIASSYPYIEAIKETDYVIAVDNWCLPLMKKNIRIDLAIGDFDSCENIDEIKAYAKKIQILPKEKNDTDTLAAIKEAKKLTDDILIIGGIEGKRIEHFIANLLLVDKFDVKMINENSYIYKLGEGEHRIKTDGYISFFTTEETVISLKNVKYELDHYEFVPQDILLISNETVNGTAIIHKGSVLVIISKKDA